MISIKIFPFAAIVALICLISSAIAQTNNPRAGITNTITTGGAAVNAVPSPVIGCYIVNPAAATESLFVDPTTTATTSVNGTNIALAAGQSWYCVPYSLKPVSVNALTSGHTFSVVIW